jgi:hypothetical protein
MNVAINIGFADNERARVVEGLSKDQSDRRLDDWLDIALEDSFPCSDPISSMRTD